MNLKNLYQAFVTGLGVASYEFGEVVFSSTSVIGAQPKKSSIYDDLVFDLSLHIYIYICVTSYLYGKVVVVFSLWSLNNNKYIENTLLIKIVCV